MKDTGLPIGKADSHGSTLKVRPPLVLGREHADAFPAAFEETFRELH
jgi:4-aminobutyrate aminotransferase-like enzyme